MVEPAAHANHYHKKDIHSIIVHQNNCSFLTDIVANDRLASSVFGLELPAASLAMLNISRTTTAPEFTGSSVSAATALGSSSAWLRFILRRRILICLTQWGAAVQAFEREVVSLVSATLRAVARAFGRQGGSRFNLLILC